MIYLGYLRVSTKKQDYGLDAQKKDILAALPAGATIEFYPEKASGTSKTRPVLNQLIERAKSTKETIIVAKLDRLSRSFLLSAELLQAQADYGFKIECINPRITTALEWGIFASLAQYERDLISERTKKGLAVAKSRGKKIGAAGHRAKAKWTAESRESVSAKTKARMAGKSMPVVSEIVKVIKLVGGPMSISMLLNKLHQAGVKTARGLDFTYQGLFRFCQRHNIDPLDYGRYAD